MSKTEREKLQERQKLRRIVRDKLFAGIRSENDILDPEKLKDKLLQLEDCGNIFSGTVGECPDCGEEEHDSDCELGIICDAIRKERGL